MFPYSFYIITQCCLIICMSHIFKESFCCDHMFNLFQMLHLVKKYDLLWHTLTYIEAHASAFFNIEVFEAAWLILEAKVLSLGITSPGEAIWQKRQNCSWARGGFHGDQPQLLTCRARAAHVQTGVDESPRGESSIDFLHAAKTGSRNRFSTLPTVTVPLYYGW